MSINFEPGTAKPGLAGLGPDHPGLVGPAVMVGKVGKPGQWGKGDV